MDGGSLCQPHAAAITPAAMMDGREGKGGRGGGGLGRGGAGQGRESQSRASITPLNLPVTARALMKEGGGGGGGGASAPLRLLVKGLCRLFSPQLEFVRRLFGDSGVPTDSAGLPELMRSVCG